MGQTWAVLLEGAVLKGPCLVLPSDTFSPGNADPSDHISHHHPWSWSRTRVQGPFTNGPGPIHAAMAPTSSAPSEPVLVSRGALVPRTQFQAADDQTFIWVQFQR